MNVTRSVLWATFAQKQLKLTSKNIRIIKYYSNCLNNEFVKSTKYSSCNVTSPMSSLNFYKCTVPTVKRYCSTAVAQERMEDTYRSENNITVIGDNIPSPYIDLEHTEFPDYIKQYLQKKAFDKPTVIQAQGWPIALSGQNFVGIAQTGTGKTLAYLLPAIVHIKEKESRKGLGPIALVLAPTRELARQIEQVAQEFKYLNIRCVCIYGGASRLVQAEKLNRGVDIVIATPGRLNDFLTSKVTNLSKCTYVVLDEADRMLDMGFEPQIRQALEGVPEERQILMFSATWPNEVKSLARDYLGEFIQVNVGSTELTANHNISQHFYVCEQDEKMEKFQSIITQLSEEGLGKVLVFANTKRFVDTLTFTLHRNGFQAAGIHGDKTQSQRDIIIHKFKSGRCNILVATDVAARGLDVDGVTHVINFDFPQTAEDYVHRIGRTGRSENKGASYTMMTKDDDRHAKSLVALLQEANQEIPNELMMMARSFHISKSLERTNKHQNRKFVYGGGPKRFNKFRRNNSFEY